MWWNEGNIVRKVLCTLYLVLRVGDNDGLIVARMGIDSFEYYMVIKVGENDGLNVAMMG